MLEIRRVPPSWQHPRDKSGRFIPMFGSFQARLRDWKKRKGDLVRPVRAVGSRPPRGSCAPFTVRQATHFQVYEDVSEGTPVSPIFASKREIAHWLRWFGISKNVADGFVRMGAVPSLTLLGGTYVEGLAGAATPMTPALRKLARAAVRANAKREAELAAMSPKKREQAIRRWARGLAKQSASIND